MIEKKKSNYLDAESYYEKAQRITESSYGEESTELCPILNNLGDTHRKRGDMDRAKDNYLKVMALFDKYYHKDHPDIAGISSLITLLFGDL